MIIINRERVFRFAKSEWAKTALRNEAKALKLARQYVDMRLPLFDVCQEEMGRCWLLLISNPYGRMLALLGPNLRWLLIV